MNCTKLLKMADGGTNFKKKKKKLPTAAATSIKCKTKPLTEKAKRVKKVCDRTWGKTGVILGCER